MIVSSASPLSRIVAAKSRWSALSGVSSNKPLMPMTAFIGVRISWLIVARNALLASFAASAWPRAASACARASCASWNSFAFWIAITAWSAKVFSSRDSRSLNGRRSKRSADSAPTTRPADTIAALSIDALRPSTWTASRRLGGTSGPLARSGQYDGTPVSSPAGAGRGNSRRSDSACSPLPACQCSRPSAPVALSASTAPGSRRCRLVQMLSNTGRVSATDSPTTRSTSALAVCCSSASCVSWNRRAFWIAITAWSAKVFSSARSRSLNGRGGRRITFSVPMPRPCHSSGAVQPAKLPCSRAMAFM